MRAGLIFCSTTCADTYKIGRHPKGNAEERFWRMIDKNGPIPAHQPGLGACWCKASHGDKRRRWGFWFEERFRYGHVVAYILTTGHEPPPETPCITHLCDNGHLGCVRPSHLIPDTQRGNVQQAVVRGRMAAGDRNGSHTRPDRIARGEQARNAKLTEDAVRAIRRDYVRRKVTQNQLAARYGISQRTVSRVIRGKIWKHVQGLPPGA
jgi:hypothetical protein